MNTNSTKSENQFFTTEWFWFVAALTLLTLVTTTSDNLFGENCVFVNGFAIVVFAYGARSSLLAKRLSIKFRLTIYCAVLILLLPYIYVFAYLIRPPLGLPVNKWLGDPVWIFAIPTLSFFVSDLSRNELSSFARIAIQFSIELILVFPIWTVAWIFIQLALTDTLM